MLQVSVEFIYDCINSGKLLKLEKYTIKDEDGKHSIKINLNDYLNTKTEKEAAGLTTQTDTVLGSLADSETPPKGSQNHPIEFNTIEKIQSGKSARLSGNDCVNSDRNRVKAGKTDSSMLSFIKNQLFSFMVLSN